MPKIRREANTLNILHNLTNAVSLPWALGQEERVVLPRSKKSTRARKRRAKRRQQARHSRRQNRR